MKFFFNFNKSYHCLKYNKNRQKKIKQRYALKLGSKKVQTFEEKTNSAHVDWQKFLNDKYKEWFIISSKLYVYSKFKF